MARTPITYSSRDFQQSFTKTYPDIKLAPGEYYNILNAACLHMQDFLLADGTFKLGNRLGDLMIRKFTPKGKGSSFTVLDKNKSKNAGKAIYQFNDHTGGFMYRFVWNKKRCKMIYDKNMWIFKPIRSIKRKLAKLIKTDKADYPIGVKENDEVSNSTYGISF